MSQEAIDVQDDGSVWVSSDTNKDGTLEQQQLITDMNLFQMLRDLSRIGVFEVIEYSNPGTITTGIKKIWTCPWPMGARIGGDGPGFGAVGTLISSPQSGPLVITIKHEGGTAGSTVVGTITFGMNQNLAVATLPETIIPPTHRIVIEVTQSASPVAQGIGLSIPVGPYLGAGE